ncbi:LysR family transcriptional regulator [Virgibacillus flavescens]|uniref:LysR family transcriptional regulator n=1 Tax=Virgibacillus flavescens TaxID=1611422 RepID=UPI003D32BC15
MDINQLRAFDSIVRLGSFDKAARHLELSQPTISVRMQRLEGIVGGALFNRAGEKIELTDLGESFLPYARQALEVLLDGVEKAHAIQKGKAGQVTIGTLPTFTNGVFSSTVGHLYKNHPEVKTEIHTGHNHDIIEMLYDGFIKIGIMTCPYYNPDLKNLLMVKERLVLVTHPSNPILSLTAEKQKSVREIFRKSSPFIVVDWSDECKRWQKSQIILDSNYLELPPTTALELVCSGYGVTLLTEAMVAKHLKYEALVKLDPIDFPDLYRELVMVSLESKENLSPAVKTFIDVFKSCSGKLE